MADSKLQDLNSGVGVATLVDADFFYAEQTTTAKFCLASVMKTYMSLSPTLVTPDLGTPSAGDISACTSNGMVMVAPVLGTPASGVLTNMTGTSVELAAMIAGNTDAITATVDGLTTGLIPATAEHVSITSSVATKQVSLPAAVAGKRIRITGPTNGCELISVVAGDKVNTVVVGATNEAALVAGSLYTLEYDGVDNWIMTGVDALGAVETPVVPDAL